MEIAGIVLNMWEDTLVARRTMAAFEKLPVPILASRFAAGPGLQAAWAQGRSILVLEPRSDVAQALRDLVATLDNTQRMPAGA